MSKHDKHNEQAFSRAGVRAMAGFGPVPAMTDASLCVAPKQRKARQLPWLFTIDQAAHYECN